MENVQKEIKPLNFFLEQVPDHRRAQGRRHSMPTLLQLYIIAVASGANSTRAVWRLVLNNFEELKTEASLNLRSVPALSTFNDLVRRLDFSELARLFTEWASQYIEEGDFLSFDGKVVGGTVKDAHSESQTYAALASAWLPRLKICVGVQVVEDSKNGEIGAVKDLLDLLGHSRIIVAADALHCQTDTAEKVVESGGDYLFCLKKNQKTTFCSAEGAAFGEGFVYEERSRGQINRWTVYAASVSDEKIKKMAESSRLCQSG